MSSFQSRLVPLLALVCFSCTPRSDQGEVREESPPPREAVSEHDGGSRIHFRATGNEPGWHLEIRDDLETRAGKRIRFVYDYGQHDAVLHAPDPEPMPGTGRTVYRGENGDLRIVVEIEDDPCRDSMSGESFESTVTVEFEGRTYRGCGRPLR